LGSARKPKSNKFQKVSADNTLANRLDPSDVPVENPSTRKKNIKLHQ